MVRWLTMVFLAGCTFSPRALLPGGGGEDAAAIIEPMPDLAEVLPEADLATGPDLLPPPSLQVSRATVGGTIYELAAEGTLDWTHYGFTTASSVDRKSGVTALITASANTTLHQWPSYTPGFTWSNGTPTSSATATHSGAYVNGPNHSFTVTLPASPVAHTAYLYLNTYNAVSSFTAQLGDGSAAPFAETMSASGNLDLRYTLTWRAASTTTLQITWTLVTDNGSGSVDLLAVTLQ